MKLKELFKKWYFWLFIVTVLAITMRSIPAWTNAAWGADFGIYYGLTSDLVKNQQIFNEYTGWGSMYSYFPILYIFSAIGHWTTGIDLMWIMPKIAPVFGGLTALIFYFIVYEMTKRRDLALLSALFLAVIPFHVYQTSHAAPLTMGHFFMLLSLYLFIKAMKQRKYLPYLMISTVLLIMSHHLTTYFFLITIFFIVVFKNLMTDTKEMVRSIAYVIAASAMTFCYWIFIATPVFSTFMSGGLTMQSYVVILLFYASFLSLIACGMLVKKYKSTLVKSIEKKLTFNADGSRKRAVVFFIIGLIAILSAEIVFLFVNFPVSGVRLKPLSIMYSIPMLLFTGFSCMGLEYMDRIENRWFFQAWICAIMGSFIYSLMTENTVLFPDRHIEYIIVPVCLFAAIGITHFFRKEQQRTWSLSFKKSFATPSIQAIFILIVAGLVLSNAVAVYPVYSSTGWMDESIPNQTVNAINWVQENLDKNTTMVATDLRLSKMLWAEGYNVTFEATNTTWSSDSWNGCYSEFNATKNHSRVTNILIDDVMRVTSVNVNTMHSIYMTNGSYNKFAEEPFVLLYKNETINGDMKVAHWAEVYVIDWKYIENNK